MHYFPLKKKIQQNGDAVMGYSCGRKRKGDPSHTAYKKRKVKNYVKNK